MVSFTVITAPPIAKMDAVQFGMYVLIEFITYKLWKNRKSIYNFIALQVEGCPTDNNAHRTGHTATAASIPLYNQNCS